MARRIFSRQVREAGGGISSGNCGGEDFDPERGGIWLGEILEANLLRGVEILAAGRGAESAGGVVWICFGC
ncbi:hypothetical protein [Campylobacter sp.]|uniref:hypothetical protein n=1 Tax=Campylobacter sp. TaxID=205 RepID=UPI0026DC9D31|nr:hypothetical protein [Campylobacter sp.]MDO4674700.1 hypothetical protein [Campylobacter sp.]